MRSNWVIKRGSSTFEVGLHPSEVLLALVANNPDEQAARNWVMAQYDDPIEGLAHFAKLYGAALQTGISMDEIVPEASPNYPQLQAV